MGKIKEDYKILFKEGVQGFFDPNKSMSEIGDGIELFIKESNILDRTGNIQSFNFKSNEVKFQLYEK